MPGIGLPCLSSGGKGESMTHGAPVNLLFVEDSAEDVQLALRALSRDGVEAAWRQVDSQSAMKVALAEGQPDAILSDFSMPGFDGLEALLLEIGRASCRER